MAPLPPAANVLAVNFKFTYGLDLDVQTKFFVGFTGASTDSNVANYVNHQIANAPFVMAVAHPDVELIEVTATDLTSDTSPQASAPASVPGTATGNPLPAQTCVLLNQTITRRYRGGKPRKYLPWGVQEDLLDPQTWKNASLGNFGAAFNSLQTALLFPQDTLNPHSLVNVSYYKGSLATTTTEVVDGIHYDRGHTFPQKRTDAAQVDTIVSTIVNHKPGSQRRRINA